MRCIKLKSYVSCPVCGTKLVKAEEVKEMEFQCGKCKHDLLINVTPLGVSVNLIFRENDTPPKHGKMCLTN